jgi:putative redox protein
MLPEGEYKLIADVRSHIGTAKYLTTISSGHHHIIVDEPEYNGGNNAGPDPQALLLASLSSCTAITLRMYTDRKMWPMEDISVDVKLFKAGLENSIECLIAYTGQLTAEQRLRLVQIAGACPVHKILEKSFSIVTTVK